MKKLTKKQLEDLGFEVITKQLKSKEKVIICYGKFSEFEDYVGYFYDYPTFEEIILQIVENAKNVAKQEFKDKFISNFLD